MNRIILFALVLFQSACANSQTTIDTASIKAQLAIIYDRDQKTRTGKDSVEYMDLIDRSNQEQVIDLIKHHGWLGESVIGVEGNKTLFLVIQHADLKTQEKYVPYLMESVLKGESSGGDLALLQDRIRIRNGMKQIYGSQVSMNPKTGLNEFFPIEDEMHVNERRKKVGLQPIEEYAKFFDIIYIAPPSNTQD